MKPGENPILDSVVDIARMESIQEWMKDHDSLKKELGSETFEKLMSEVSVEIVALQYATKDNAPPISYAAAGMLLAMDASDLSKEDYKLYRRNVNAAIAWGCLNGLQKK